MGDGRQAATRLTRGWSWDLADHRSRSRRWPIAIFFLYGNRKWRLIAASVREIASCQEIAGFWKFFVLVNGVTTLSFLVAALEPESPSPCPHSRFINFGWPRRTGFPCARLFTDRNLCSVLWPSWSSEHQPRGAQRLSRVQWMDLVW